MPHAVGASGGERSIERRAATQEGQDGVVAGTGRKQLESFKLHRGRASNGRICSSRAEQLNPMIAELGGAIEQEVENCPEARRLTTHPGVGPLTGPAFVLIMGRGGQFGCGKPVPAIGLMLVEESSGGRQRLGHIQQTGEPVGCGLNPGSFTCVVCVRIAALPKYVGVTEYNVGDRTVSEKIEIL